jgi:DNA-binding transcriptional LysR family regulator
MIDVRLLRHAIALAIYRNYARAARELHISQPTLTRSIQALEAHLGCQLFDRRSRTVLPTPAGEEMLKYARQVVASSQALVEGIRQFRGLHDGTISIGLGPYAASIIAGKALGRFNAKYPGIRVTAMIDDWVNLPRRLKAREFDLVLMEASELETDHELEIKPLLPHQGFLFCSSAHPALKEKSQSLENLIHYPFVLPTLPQRLLTMFGGLFANGDVTFPLDRMSIIQSNDLSLIRNVVANSQAIGLASYGMIAEELRGKRFAALPFRIPELRTDYGIVTRKHLSLPPAASVLMEILVETNAAQCAEDTRFVDSLGRQPGLRSGHRRIPWL